MRSFRQVRAAACVGWVTLCVAGLARAQTDESMLLEPWEPDKHLAAHVDAFVFPQAKLGNHDGTIHLFEGEGAGRYQLPLGYELNPTFGYDYTFLNLDQRHRPDAAPRLPRQLTDASFGFGTPLAQAGERAFIGATVAGGYAGDDAFGDGRAWYAKASLIYGRELAKDRALLIILDYNGNRSFLPETPVPTIAYSDKFNDELSYVVGLPIIALFWKPNEHFKIDFDYYVPDSLDFKATYSIDKHLSLFLGYGERQSPFRDEAIRGDRRIFYHEHRAELGVAYKLADGIQFEAAGGWAFGRSFDRGFDAFDLHRIARVTDAPFLRFTLAIAR